MNSAVEIKAPAREAIGIGHPGLEGRPVRRVADHRPEAVAQRSQLARKVQGISIEERGAGSVAPSASASKRRRMLATLTAHGSMSTPTRWSRKTLATRASSSQRSPGRRALRIGAMAPVGLEQAPSCRRQEMASPASGIENPESLTRPRNRNPQERARGQSSPGQRVCRTGRGSFFASCPARLRRARPATPRRRRPSGRRPSIGVRPWVSPLAASSRRRRLTSSRKGDGRSRRGRRGRLPRPRPGLHQEKDLPLRAPSRRRRWRPHAPCHQGPASPETRAGSRRPPPPARGSGQRDREPRKPGEKGNRRIRAFQVASHGKASRGDRSVQGSKGEIFAPTEACHGESIGGLDGSIVLVPAVPGCDDYPSRRPNAVVVDRKAGVRPAPGPASTSLQLVRPAPKDHVLT